MVEVKRNVPVPQNMVDGRLTQEQILLHNWLERIYALTTELICIAGFDGYFKDINPAFEKLLGFTRAELLATPFINLVHPDDRAATLEVFSGLMQGQDTADFENRYQCKDGGWKRLSWNANCDLEEQLVFAVAQDVTKRKQAEDALRTSEQLYRAIGESIDYGVWACEPDGRNIYASDSYLKLVGITQEQCSNFGWGDTLHPEDAERTIAAWKECVRTGGKWDIEHRFRGADGQWHPILARGVPVRNEQGEIIRWVGINLDISRMKSAEDGLRKANERLEKELKERQQTEAALREYQYLLNETQRIAKIGGWKYDLATRRVTWTDEVYDIYGVTKDFDPGSPDQDIQFYAPDDQKIINEAFQRAVDRGEPYDLELQLDNARGERLWVRTSGQVEYQKDKVVSVFGHIMDITERRRVEDALSKSEQQLKSIYDTVGDCIFLLAVELNKRYRFISVNKAFVATTGINYDQVVGKFVTEIIPEPSLTTVIEKYNKAIREKAIVHWEEISDYPMGRLTGEVSVVPVFDATGNCTHLVGTVHDISDRKRIENALQQYSKQLAVINRLDHIISSSLDIGTVYDSFVAELKELVDFDHTAIVLLDDGGENWQITRQWTTGKPAFQLVKWYPLKGTALELVVQHQQAFAERILGEQIEWPEQEGLRQEGIQCRVLLPLIIQGKVTGLLTLGSRQPNAYPPDDIDLLQTLADQLAIAVQNARLYAQARLTADELEQRVLARTQQLEQANKDLESFSYSVSHDLRAPLRSINGFSQILARRHRECLDEEGRHYLDNVVEASNRMGLLIDDLLQYSRIGRASVHRKIVSLDDLFAQILADLSSRISETQAVIEFPPAGSIPRILSDATILGQIFSNIIGNALTYHQAGVAPVIKVIFQIEGDHYLFGIADNGIGIPAKYLEIIFNVFQRLHSTDEYPGTGIGLAIVKKSADLLGGQVWAESTDGAGSTFWIRIPKE